VLLVGHSDDLAPLIGKEIRQIQGIFPKAAILYGPDATAAKLKSGAETCGIIHVASHGRFLKQQPFFSGLLLSDGWFTLPQIYQLKLNADLVTLSGCETGGNEVAAGDELLGMVRGFLYAGAASLMVSLWRVSDESTVHFMHEFYSELSRHSGKADAWRVAVQRTRERWPHPYYWGPFLLVGKP
jgi:CHAT domain-containing protein